MPRLLFLVNQCDLTKNYEEFVAENTIGQEPGWDNLAAVCLYV